MREKKNHGCSVHICSEMWHVGELTCSFSSPKVISMLPQCHRNVFNYIAAFLRELLKNSTCNRLDVGILGKNNKIKKKIASIENHFMELMSNDVL